MQVHVCATLLYAAHNLTVLCSLYLQAMPSSCKPLGILTNPTTKRRPAYDCPGLRTLGDAQGVYMKQVCVLQ